MDGRTDEWIAGQRNSDIDSEARHTDRQTDRQMESLFFNRSEIFV